MSRSITSNDPYLNTLLKFIPSEIVAAYLAIQGILKGWSGSTSDIVTVVLFVALFVLTPLHLFFLAGVRSVIQIIATMFSFVVWVYILGGPFIVWGIHDLRIGSVILIVWTLILPILGKVKGPERRMP